MIEVLKAKIHRATVTDTSLDYEGSITIDTNLLEVTGILPFEAVEVYDIDNGSRFKTYVIEGAAGSGEICINGAAARLVEAGHLVIIVAYRFVEEGQFFPAPKVVLVDEKNRPRT